MFPVPNNSRGQIMRTTPQIRIQRDPLAWRDDLKYRELSEELGQEQALTALQH